MGLVPPVGLFATVAILNFQEKSSSWRDRNEKFLPSTLWDLHDGEVKWKLTHHPKRPLRVANVFNLSFPKYAHLKGMLVSLSICFIDNRL